MFDLDEPAQDVPPPQQKVYVRRGLGGLDDDLDLLQTYFKDLQTMTVETSMSTDLDLLTFAISAHYFGVIMLKTSTKKVTSPSSSPHSQSFPPSNAPAVRFEEDVFPDSSAQIAPIITEEQFLALPEEEQKARWREAFRAKIEGELDSDDEDEPGPSSRIQHFPPSTSLAREAAALSSDLHPEGHRFKGKMREPDLFIRPIPFAPQTRPTPSTEVFGDSADDLINWPDDASDADDPPSSIGDSSSCHGDESSAEDVFSPFETDAFGDIDAFSPVQNDFGREYLEPEAGPVARLPEIPQDPAVKKMIMESAIKLQLQMQAKTVCLYEEKKARKAARASRAPPPLVQAPALASWGNAGLFIGDASSNADITTKTRPIGLVYLTSSQNFSDFLHLGECNIGLYIAPEHRNLPEVKTAVNTVIEDAFRDHDCHRLQAILVDHKDKLDFLTLFTSVGFRREGTRRHAYFSPITSEWKDVTYLAILVTEWVYDHSTRSDTRLLPTSLWDEVLTRHQREQEEIIQLEERKFGYGSSSLKRTSSMETIREMTAPTPLNLDSGAESSGFSTDSSTSSAIFNPKRRKLTATPLHMSSGFNRRRTSLSSESGFDSDWEAPIFGNVNMNAQRSPSFRGTGNSEGTSKRSSGFGSDSSSSSKEVWDMMNDF
ncbi:hypothetical protein CPB83DRAFT_834575 [Crepidotus variabilis]|uniref:Uncharacterized protein n=1 Tax=Crepidotus variabilis TaxID=179855 RepID=A0A9P6EJF0_9AGAR|nr:hypothetical protein CPB83DRAFT_834575 [Crepidotus variabilis]